MKFLCGAILCLLLLNVSGGEAWFELKKSGKNKNFTLAYKQQPLIVSENFDPGFQESGALEENINGEKVLNAWGCSQNIPWRREIATVGSTDKGSEEIEISFQAYIPAFNNDIYNGAINYYFDVPVALLDCAEYTAIVGRHGKPAQIKGRISKADKNGLVAGSVRNIAFAKDDLNLVFDLNPAGVQDLYSSYTIGSICGMWRLEKVGDVLRFIVGTKSSRNGGVHTSKAVIYNGSAQDYNLRHAHNKYSYYSELPAERRFVFGADKFSSGRFRAHSRYYTPQATCGWLGKPVFKVEKYHKQGALYAAVSGHENAEYQVDLPRKGLYIVSFGTSTDTQKAGAMNIKVNGKSVVEHMNIPPRTVQQISVPLWIESGKAVVEFSGAWRISTMDFQLLLSSYEDFSFRRGFWRSRIKQNPAPFFMSEHYAQEPAYKTKISSFPLPEPGKEAVGALQMPAITTQYGDLSNMQEVFAAPMISSWGTSNAGTFTEFNEEAMKRNVQELEKNGINIVMFSGMLARHTFESHRSRLHDVIGKYVKAGRDSGRDFIFIDHMDYSMLWNSDSGFRVLTQWTDRLQETIDGNLPGRARCMTNPRAVEDFYDVILEHIRKTGIDGIMVDECCFMGKTFCGCAECRKLFTAETNWQLPADELSPELYNNKSTLWRAWEEWRRRKIGDFWVNLRKKVSEYRKDFIFIGYTTHYGLTSNWASNELAGDIFNFARAWDIVGTEIMTRNIFANYRAVNSLRHAFSLFGRNGRFPVCGLVYASDWKIKYFGWALNNMNGQLTWESTFVPCPEGEINYRTFSIDKGNMDLRIARSAAQVAVLFPETSRNMAGSVPAAGGYRAEMLGTSQILSALHIDHTFISEADLTSDALKRFKVLILGNAPYLSDEQIKVIRKFAADGGVVSASFMTAVANELGELRQQDMIAEIFNAGKTTNAVAGSKAFSVSLSDDKVLPLAKELLYRALPQSKAAANSPKIYSKNGKAHAAVLEKKFGKGKFVYYPGMYGAVNAAPEVMVGKSFNFAPAVEMEMLQKNLLSDLTAGCGIWQPLNNWPDDVLSNSFYQQDKLLIHLLNATGSKIKNGEKIRFDIGKNPFPVVQDLELQVNSGKYGRAYAVSPDFAGKRDLKVEKNGNTLKIKLPAELLKVYTIIYVE
ncbi:MAG: hypothetical protein E7056_00800 [Lentisphaerae bacterium]|nr:hypothetical protein [Lentisphaerota bacterium]